MSERIERLPKDHRGYPVPWFVQWVDGKPQFPVVDYSKFKLAVEERLCWVCGDRLGSYMAFVVGPMCGISRTSAEPPVHKECGEFSVKNCPFLSNPNMKRIDNEMTKQCVDMPGIAIKRNPGVSLLWITRGYRLFAAPDGGALVNMGDPVEISFWYKGRPATYEETIDSVVSGCPALEKMAEEDGDLEHFAKAKNRFLTLVNYYLGGPSDT